eukprot:CAMPEP_0175149670 /NCGR_PEP_ID=MMETSP0087-20121206/17382_1 /TAXON_ID=136419 /ORGANISM="Unknown Unknown, Strain D1" /LENGTH=397 /DNA_ID=CAMNT_0016435407 /DNA_START=461 /DNA_END=1651 /DNA_ORIENTATION=+
MLGSGNVSKTLQQNWTTGWDQLAAFLINIVFSALFLGVHIPRVGTVWKKAGPQLTYGMVLAFGQWSTAMLVTGTVLVHFGVPALFACALPVGFAGGHGTAAGLSDTFTEAGWKDGGSVSLASATFGLIGSILFGVAWVNLAARKGWVQKAKMDSAPDAKLSIRGVYQTDSRPIAGVQTTAPDSIDTLAFHLAVIGMAMLFGYSIKQAFIAIENTSDQLKKMAFLSGFPLFPLCMGGGILIQWSSEKWMTRTKLIDASIMERLSGTALDFLVTGAIASVNVSGVASDIVPFLILMLAGVLWHFCCLYFLAPRLLPNHWFERGAAEMGMSMGVIASGLVLLRMVDPESKSPVPADFAYKQLLHSPFMGGGIWTALAVPLTKILGTWIMFAISTSIVVLW